jgi:hypothetical protein
MGVVLRGEAKGWSWRGERVMAWFGSWVGGKCTNVVAPGSGLYRRGLGRGTMPGGLAQQWRGGKFKMNGLRRHPVHQVKE